MENNLPLEQFGDLVVIAAALERYRDYMAKDIELSADHPNIARYFQRCANDADRVLKYVRAQLGLPEKPWKNTETAGLTSQEIEGGCEGCAYFDYERDERPCCECSRLPGRVDRYVEEDETLADAFPSLHEENNET